jgi:hypothetical protein
LKAMDIDVIIRQVNELAAWKAEAEQRLAELERRHGEHVEAVTTLSQTVARIDQPARAAQEPPAAPARAKPPARE